MSTTTTCTKSFIYSSAIKEHSSCLPCKDKPAVQTGTSKQASALSIIGSPDQKILPALFHRDRQQAVGADIRSETGKGVLNREWLKEAWNG